MKRVSFAGQLTSVPDSEPHGTLTVTRGGQGVKVDEAALLRDPLLRDLKLSKDQILSLGSLEDISYKSILVKVDGKWVFKEIEGKTASFRLAPGKHEVEAEYLWSGSGYQKTSPAIKGVIEVKEKGVAFVNVISDGKKIRMSLLTPALQPEKGSRSISTFASPGKPREEDIAHGLTLISGRQYTKAASSLDSGLKWLKSDPSYKATTDSLVSKEAEYLSKLIDQIRRADQKGVFGSSDPMAKVIEKAIEAQAKVIKSIDDRRLSQSGNALAPTALGTPSRIVTETKSG